MDGPDPQLLPTKRKKGQKNASKGEASSKPSGGAPGGPPKGPLPRESTLMMRQSSSFEAIGCVPRPVVECLSLLGFTHCTPVQEATLPLLLPPLQQQKQQQQRPEVVSAAKRFSDVAVEAPTGSGKTLAFLIPAVSRLLLQLLQNQQQQEQQQEQQEQQQEQQQQQRKALLAALTETPEELAAAAAAAAGDGPAAVRCRLGALVIGPTRELCCQTRAVLQQILSSLERVLLQQQTEETNSSSRSSSSRFLLRCLYFTGGSRHLEGDCWLLSKKGSRRGLYILCATPGRLLRLLGLPLQQQPLWDWKGLNFLVVDEADRLLDEQHAQQLQQLHAAAAAARQHQLLPAERRQQQRLQTAFFSATLSGAMQQQLIKGLLKEPVCVRVTAEPFGGPPGGGPPQGLQEAPQVGGAPTKAGGAPAAAAVQHSVPTTLRNCVVTFNYSEKLPFLFKFIQRVVLGEGRRCIVFCLTCQCVEYYLSLLQEWLRASLSPQETKETKETMRPGRGDTQQQRGGGRLVEKLHGRMKQRARSAALNRFCSSSSGALVLLATDVAARGLDFPNVEWIVQLDPPQNPEVFIHRIGRTARAGRGGAALLLLLPHEEAYETFLVNRGVALSPFKETAEGQQMQQTAAAAEGEEETGDRFVSKAETAEINDALQVAVQQDQALIQKGSRAFVSFVRAYKEHQLSFLLPFARLNLGSLATAMRLLRIPRMREVLGKSLKDFQQSEIDPATVPFKHDPRRECGRQQQLQQLLTKRAEQQHAREKRQLQETKGQQKDIRKQKRTTSDKRHAKKQQAIDEWKELAFEERMARKLRRGRITEEAYDSLIAKGPQEETQEACSSSLSGSDSEGDSSEGETAAASGKETAKVGAACAGQGRRKPSWVFKKNHRKKRRR